MVYFCSIRESGNSHSWRKEWRHGPAKGISNPRKMFPPSAGRRHVRVYTSYFRDFQQHFEGRKIETVTPGNDESYAERLRLLKQLRLHILKTETSPDEKKRQLKGLTALTIEELQREVEKI